MLTFVSCANIQPQKGWAYLVDKSEGPVILGMISLAVRNKIPEERHVRGLVSLGVFGSDT
jgi:hypothetical protein